MVEASPAAPLVMSKAEFLLEFLIIAFDPPAQLGQIDQPLEGDVVGQVGEPIFGRLLLTRRPFDQQPFLGSGFLEPVIAVGGAHPYPGKTRGQPIRRSLAPSDRLPRLLWKAERERLGLHRLVLAITAGPAGWPAAARPRFRRQRRHPGRPSRGM